MHFGPLTPQASGFLCLIDMLISGFGLLYVVSGRLNAEGFVCHIDRSAIRRTDHGHSVVFWRVARSACPVVCVEDSASWLWTLLTWRAERRARFS
jgi:hypothetical protein